MLENIVGVSNLNDQTVADYPSAINGQTFSINEGFTFTLTFRTTDQADNGNYCLIQLVTASQRILTNATHIQTTNLNNLPCLDGDVMGPQQLWYSDLTTIEVNAPGDHEINLEDDPQTSRVEEFIGVPTGLQVNEQFVIIFARYLGQQNYEQLQQWTWEYNDNANKEGGVWQGNFNHNFQDGEMVIDLNSFNGEVRANNETQTHLEELQ
jgi:hypothetical protein